MTATHVAPPHARNGAQAAGLAQPWPLVPMRLISHIASPAPDGIRRRNPLEFQL